MLADMSIFFFFCCCYWNCIGTCGSECPSGNPGKNVRSHSSSCFEVLVFNKDSKCQEKKFMP